MITTRNNGALQRSNHSWLSTCALITDFGPLQEKTKEFRSRGSEQQSRSGGLVILLGSCGATNA